MTANNLTIKAQELLQQAVNLAVAGGQQAVEPVHILSAMLREEDSIGVYQRFQGHKEYKEEKPCKHF